MSWNPENLPPIGDKAFLELSDEERRTLAKPPTKGQLQHVLEHHAFRYLVARIKATAAETTNKLMSGVGIPEGLHQASNREAYFIGLVNGDREVLDLRRQLWEEAIEREGAEEEEPTPEMKFEPEEPLGQPETQ